MKSITAFLSAAAQHLRTEATASSLAPSAASACTQATTSTQNAPRAPKSMQKQTSTRRFTASSLSAYGDVMDAAAIDRVLAQFADPGVQRAAGELAFKQLRLHELAAYRSAIAEAVFAQASAGISPVEFLHRRCEDMEQEIEDTKLEHAAHDAVRKVRLATLQPLLLAVSRYEIRASEERRSLTARIDALRSNFAGNTDEGAHRYRSLVALNFSAEQIKAAGVPQPETNNAPAIASMRERIAVLDSVIAQCLAYSADPFKSPEHLAGLEGFDQLLEARQVAEAALA